MNKTDLINKIELYLDKNSIESSIGSELYISKFIDELLLLKSNVSEEIFLKTFRILKYSILDESKNTDYIVAENAIFGEFKDIRNAGFYNRYLHNVKLTSTYLKAYQLTENEYTEIFGKKRYSSYDSFRIIKNRIIKKE
jgi:hypothetical protein